MSGSTPGRGNSDSLVPDKRQPRILFVTESPLHAPLAGDHLVTGQYIDALGDLSVLDCITLRPGSWNVPGKPSRRSRVVSDRWPTKGMRWRAAARAALMGRPLIRERCSDIDLASVESAIVEFEPDLVVLDHLRCGWLAVEPSVGRRRIIYIAHNAEHAAYESTSRFEPNPVLRRFLRRQAEATRELERRVLQSVSLTVTLTGEDAERLAALSPQSKIEVIPPWVSFDTGAAPRTADRQTVLLVGSYLWHAKRRNACWLMQDVWPIVRRAHQDARLEIVGRGAELLAPCVPPGCGITLRPNVASVSEYLGRASVFVNPERQMGGIKLKTLEAAIAGLPIVSTSAGVEGTGLAHRRHCLVADQSLEFARSVSALLDDGPLREELGANARQAMLTHGDKTAFQRRLRVAISRAIFDGRRAAGDA